MFAVGKRHTESIVDCALCVQMPLTEYLLTGNASFVSRTASISNMQNVKLKGMNVLQEHVVITVTNPIRVGKYSVIQEATLLDSSAAAMKIEDFVFIESHCKIEASFIGMGSRIGKGAILGKGAVLADHVQIDNGAFVAAFASIPPFTRVTANGMLVDLAGGSFTEKLQRETQLFYDTFAYSNKHGD